uniref:NADH-ubiquinone oxidoreductase chain 6 n=1 Tax=Sirthenea flavipes TaxID=941641 RepID=L7N9L8_9HEMI|nr:NADH dehydrogenase subunit 6 [Sirthenea flavipes]ADU58107.1 NADH dehydrogenase subunit 6 [Sirthenea flavipes]
MMMMMMSFIASSIFPLMKHPLSMGLTLIVQTIIISIISGMMVNMFWFSYILVMTIISGMLILFIYMASVASNEKFQSSMKIMYYAILVLSLSTILSFLVDNMEMKKMWSPKKESIMDTDYPLTLVSMFNLESMFVTILMVSYLLLCMVIVSNVVNVHEGPLRTKN